MPSSKPFRSCIYFPPGDELGGLYAHFSTYSSVYSESSLRTHMSQFCKPVPLSRASASRSSVARLSILVLDVQSRICRPNSQSWDQQSRMLPTSPVDKLRAPSSHSLSRASWWSIVNSRISPSLGRYLHTS